MEVDKSEQESKLRQMLEKLDMTADSINGAANVMMEMSRNGETTACIEIWKQAQVSKRNEGKLCMYYLMHECIKRFDEDKQEMLKKFPDALNEIFFKDLIECTEQTIRTEIEKLVNIWKMSGFYSESYTEFLINMVRKADKEHPIAPKAKEFGVSIKVKFFALYFKYFTETKTKLEKK